MSNFLAIRRTVSSVLMMCVVLLLTAAPLRAAEPPVLNLVTADAEVAFVVPNAAKLSQKISMLNDAMGLGLPPLADALGALKQQMGVIKGMRDDGAIIVVMPTLPNLDGPGGEPPMVMLMPVADYGAFVANFGGNAADAVTNIQVGGGAPGFAKSIDGYAVMGPNKALVEAYKPGNKGAALMEAAGKLGGRGVETGDMFLYVNMAAMSPQVIPKLRQAQEMIDANLQHQAGADPNLTPANIALASSVLKIYFDSGAALLRDGNTAIISLDISELGVGMTGSIQFKKGSYLAGLFANGGDSAGKLAKMPNQPYLFASASNMEGFPLATLVEEAVGRLPKDGAPNGFLAIITKMVPLLKTVKGVSQVFYLPPQGGGIGASMINGASVIETTDAKAYIAGNKEYITSLNNVTIGVPAAPAAPGAAPAADAGITFTTQYTANALQIDGVQVDQFDVKYTLPAAMMQQMGQLGPALMMMGGTGQTGYIASSGNYVLTTTTLNVNLVRDTLAALKANTGLGAQPTIAQVRQSLTPKPSMEMYIGVAGLFATGNNFMAMFGKPAIQVPANLPPVGYSVSLGEGGVADRLFVPVPVVKACMDAYKAVAPMMGGMGGGDAGPQRGNGPAPAPF